MVSPSYQMGSVFYAIKVSFWVCPLMWFEYALVIYESKIMTTHFWLGMPQHFYFLKYEHGLTKLFIIQERNATAVVLFDHMVEWFIIDESSLLELKFCFGIYICMLERFIGVHQNVIVTLLLWLLFPYSLIQNTHDCFWLFCLSSSTVDDPPANTERKECAVRVWHVSDCIWPWSDTLIPVQNLLPSLLISFQPKSDQKNDLWPLIGHSFPLWWPQGFTNMNNSKTSDGLCPFIGALFECNKPVRGWFPEQTEHSAKIFMCDK